MLQLTQHQLRGGPGGLCWLPRGRSNRSSGLITQVVAEGRRVQRSLERAPPTYHPPPEDDNCITSLPHHELFSSAPSSVDDDLLDYPVASNGSEWRVRMDELERLSAELLANLHELNTAPDGLDPAPVVTSTSRERSHEAAGTSAATGSLGTSSHKGRKRQKASTPAIEKDQQAEPKRRGRKQKEPADSEQQEQQGVQQKQSRREKQQVASLPQLSPLLPAKPGTPPVAPPGPQRKSHAEKVILRKGADAASAPLAVEGSSRPGFKLLTRQDEVELASIVKDALMLERVKGQLQRIMHRPPTTEEWARAVGMDDPGVFTARLGMGQAAKAAMVSHNIRFVHHIAKSFHHRGVSHEDLFTAGMQGLLMGVERFDGKKGIKFSTYSYWWIRQALTKAIVRQGRIVGLPDHVMADLRLLFSAETALREEQEGDPTLEQLSARLNMPVEKISSLRQVAKSVESLDVSTGRDSDGNSDNKSVALEDHRATPDDVLDLDMLKRDVQELLNSGLTRREAAVLRRRLLLGMPLQDVARSIGVCPERVRQIEKSAIATLRRNRGVKVEEYSSRQAEQRSTARASMGMNKGG